MEAKYSWCLLHNKVPLGRLNGANANVLDLCLPIVQYVDQNFDRLRDKVIRIPTALIRQGIFVAESQRSKI